MIQHYQNTMAWCRMKQLELMPRNIVKHYQNTKAICRIKGAPDLFITFTCYPIRIEILEELARMSRRRSENHPDTVSWVFRTKLKDLQSDLTNKYLFGNVISDTLHYLTCFHDVYHFFL